MKSRIVRVKTDNDLVVTETVTMAGVRVIDLSDGNRLEVILLPIEAERLAAALVAMAKVARTKLKATK